MKTIDLVNLLKPYDSGWVALSEDYKEVVAHGNTLKEVTEKVNKKKRTDVVLISASSNYRGFVTAV